MLHTGKAKYITHFEVSVVISKAEATISVSQLYVKSLQLIWNRAPVDEIQMGYRDLKSHQDSGQSNGWMFHWIM